MLIHFGVPFPRTHNLSILMQMISSICPIPPYVAAARSLTDYAVTTRYPGHYEVVSEEEYHEAIGLASGVVGWAEQITGNHEQM